MKIAIGSFAHSLPPSDVPDCRSDLHPCCLERPQVLHPHQVIGLEQPVPQAGAQPVQCRAAAVDASGGESVQLHPSSPVLTVSAGPFPPGETALSGSAVGLQRRGTDSPLFLTRQKCLNHCRRQNFRRARLRPVPPLRQTPAGICRAAPPRPASGPSPRPQTGHGCPGSAAFP